MVPNGIITIIKICSGSLDGHISSLHILYNGLSIISVMVTLIVTIIILIKIWNKFSNLKLYKYK